MLCTHPCPHIYIVYIFAPIRHKILSIMLISSCSYIHALYHLLRDNTEKWYKMTSLRGNCQDRVSCSQNCTSDVNLSYL